MIKSLSHTHTRANTHTHMRRSAHSKRRHERKKLEELFFFAFRRFMGWRLFTALTEPPLFWDAHEPVRFVRPLHVSHNEWLEFNGTRQSWRGMIRGKGLFIWRASVGDDSGPQTVSLQSHTAPHRPALSLFSSGHFGLILLWNNNNKMNLK